eukprot:m.43002 g.43002  ORF g.43002 m.43002 type:complete len:207 (+) comp8386_c0_seq1:1531-2151(+)
MSLPEAFRRMHLDDVAEPHVWSPEKTSLHRGKVEGSCVRQHTQHRAKASPTTWPGTAGWDRQRRAAADLRTPPRRPDVSPSATSTSRFVSTDARRNLFTTDPGERDAVSPTMTSLFSAMALPSHGTDSGPWERDQATFEPVDPVLSCDEFAFSAGHETGVVRYGDAGMVISEPSEVEYDDELAFLLQRNTLGLMGDTTMDTSSYIS